MVQLPPPPPPHLVQAPGHGARDNDDPVPYKSYEDPDTANPLPVFAPSRLSGIHFDVPLLRNTMARAVD